MKVRAFQHLTRILSILEGVTGAVAEMQIYTDLNPFAKMGNLLPQSLYLNVLGLVARP